MAAQRTPRIPAVLGGSPGTLMPGKGEPHSSRLLKAPAALVASVAVRKVLHVGWKLVTGTEPPAAPDDKQVPFGQAVAWAALFGGAVATSRMMASRYASSLWLSRAQRRGPPEPGQVDGPGPPPQPGAPSLASLMAVAALAWRRRR
jgi:MYXO-CTERM domain-containing protein